MPNKAFFHQNLKLLGLGRQFGQINFGAFGHFGTVSPLSMFSINLFLFLQKTKPVYILIPNIYLGLGFEFGPTGYQAYPAKVTPVCLRFERSKMRVASIGGQVSALASGHISAQARSFLRSCMPYPRGIDGETK